MEATQLTREKVTIAFAPNELAFFCSAINESLEAVEEWEFQTRTGETRERAAEMLAQLRTMLNEAERS